MTRLLEQLPGNRPSRAIIALAAHGARELDATAEVVTTPSPSGAGELRCELVTLAAGDEGAALPSLIASLLLPDLPVFLLLRLDPERWEPLVKACWSFATSRRRRLDRRALGPPLAAGVARARAQAQRHRSLLVEADGLARARGPPLRPAARNARAGAPRPHPGDARGPLAGPGAAAGGLDPEQNQSPPDRGADQRGAPGHAPGLARQRRPDLPEGALRGGASRRGRGRVAHAVPR